MSYLRRDNHKTCTCKFCGMEELQWAEVAPDKFRLKEPSGDIHDCRQFHDNKRNGPPATSSVDRGSTLRRLNNWMQRYGHLLDDLSSHELEAIIDDMAKR